MRKVGRYHPTEAGDRDAADAARAHAFRMIGKRLVLIQDGLLIREGRVLTAAKREGLWCLAVADKKGQLFMSWAPLSEWNPLTRRYEEQV